MKLSTGKTRLSWLLNSLRITGQIALMMIMVVSSTIVRSESQSSTYYSEKNTLDEAKRKKSVEILNQFILKYPNSVWIGQATYYRDKQALDDAKSTETIAAVDNFMQQYPNSGWLNNAIHTRDKKAYDQAKKTGNKTAFEEFLSKYPDSKWKQKVEKKLAALSKKESANMPVSKITAKNKELLTSNERVSRALALYKSINEEKAKKAAKKELRLAKLQKQKNRCYVLKDKVRQYGERRLWYALDETGSRTYLTDEEVVEKRRDIKSNYAEKCSKFKL
jgi:outer membrane protein assembly factor BamD (BamD/ComL family)